MHGALSIRPCEPDDLQALVAILSIPEVSQGYLGGRYAMVRLLEILLNNQARVRAPGHTVWVVVEDLRDTAPGSIIEDSLLIGYARLMGGELSYFMHPRYWRRQIATQLLRYVCSQGLAHQTQNSVHARVFRENIASIKTLEKLGFRFSGLSWQLLQGQPLDVAMLDYELRCATAPSFGQPSPHILPRKVTIPRHSRRFSLDNGWETGETGGGNQGQTRMALT